MWNQLKKQAQKDLTVCVDVDNTLLTYDGYEKNKFGMPIKELVDKLKELKESGIKLVLSTARQSDELDALNEHLEKLGLRNMFDEVKAGEKVIAVAYLDDKAVNVKDTDWQERLSEMIEREINKD
jgi:hydroxymethylpyrimidine pyrophosphatase-like HAD family hydrolase